MAESSSPVDALKSIYPLPSFCGSVHLKNKTSVEMGMSSIHRYCVTADTVISSSVDRATEKVIKKQLNVFYSDGKTKFYKAIYALAAAKNVNEAKQKFSALEIHLGTDQALEVYRKVNVGIDGNVKIADLSQDNILTQLPLWQAAQLVIQYSGKKIYQYTYSIRTLSDNNPTSLTIISFIGEDIKFPREPDDARAAYLAQYQQANRQNITLRLTDVPTTPKELVKPSASPQPLHLYNPHYQGAYVSQLDTSQSDDKEGFVVIGMERTTSTDKRVKDRPKQLEAFKFTFTEVSSKGESIPK